MKSIRRIRSPTEQANSGYHAALLATAVGSTTSQVARLDVDPTFTKITDGPAVTDLARSWGASWGDYDNDGYLDLSVGRSRLGTSCIYLNNRDGTFSRLADPPGLETVTSLIHWGDYDNDGRVNLFVASFNETSTIYRNLGDGEFELSVWASTHRTCTIESYADLVTWTTFTTVPGKGETPVTVTDPGAPGQDHRFYRM